MRNTTTTKTSRAAHGSRRGFAKAAAAAGVAAGFVVASLASMAAPAYASVVSSAYTIGSPSGSVGSVTASPASVGAGAATSFTVKFTASGALSGGAASWVTITPSEALTSAPASVDLLDDSGSGCIQAGTAGTGGAGTTTVTGITLELGSSCSISAGNTVEVDFNANAPSGAGSFHFTVATSANTTPAASNDITIGSSGATLSAVTVAFGANTTYSISNIHVLNLSSSQNTLTLAAVPTQGTEALTFYGGTSGYSVTSTSLGGSTTADPVDNAALGTGDTSVTLTLGTSLADGDVLSITATGTNPAASTTAQADAIKVTPGNGSPQTTSAITFGSSVSSVTVSPSVLSAGATATYAVTFKATSGVASSGDIYLKETAGPTNFSSVTGILVEDTTQSWHFVASGATLASGSATIPLQDTIVGGDALVVTLENVTNPPSAGTVSDFAVTTSSDSVPAYASPYRVGSSSSAGVTVSVNPSTTAAVATYSISGLVASAPLAGGSSTIGIDAPSGTVFPANAGYYSIADSTTASGSGTATAVSGGGSNDVTVTVPANINAGDHLSLTVEDAINPGLASSSYTISLLGDVTGPVASALPGFPSSGVDFPNGAIVSFSGTLYVMAGGHAFGIPNRGDLAALQRVDHAAIVDAPSGAVPPSKPPRMGTLMFTRPVDGNPTIYVVGTDGDLHGFATPAQFVDDGYDPALVVTVPSLTGLILGAPAGQEGAAGNALSTSADGAMVDSAGAFYVFAGGHAFGVPNPATLERLKKADKARPLSGSVSPAQKSATIADGVLLSAAGPVYVSYQGKLWPFKSMKQLDNDGYAGTAAVPVPSAGGITLVGQYSGS